MFKKSEIREIKIVQEPTGCFVATVGCAKIPVKDSEQLIVLLKAYLENPKQVEKDYQACRAKGIQTQVGNMHQQYEAAFRGVGPLSGMYVGYHS